MNTTMTMEELEINSNEQKPGAQLAIVRKQKGYTPEYVASKLHLRVRIIELLEADEYEKMPEPVFIKGYLRAYAKVLDISPEPFLATFNKHYMTERKLEKALWQNRKETNKAEKAVHWLTALFTIAALISIGVWWYKNKETIPATELHKNTASINNSESEIRLTDLSKMRSLLGTDTQLTLQEKKDG